jgi:hypothetical protein
MKVVPIRFTVFFSLFSLLILFLQSALLDELYKIEEPTVAQCEEDGNVCINIEGYLEKLPSGRRKATFWNAWKSRYFRLKDGSLFYYQVNAV